MSQEIEAKIQLAGFAKVRVALNRLGAEFMGAVLQTDSFYDTSDHRLMKSDSAIRIRHQRLLKRGSAKFNVRPLLTAKGPRLPAGDLKVRTEHQSYLEDAGTTENLMRDVGMKRTLVIQKKRSSYRLGRCAIELDELPLIGRFVEIEGPSAAAVQRVRAKLGLADSPGVTESYTYLLRSACRRLKLPFREVKFEASAPKSPRRR